MKLEELLQFDHIIVQCHDNPDADAPAAGYGVRIGVVVAKQPG